MLMLRYRRKLWRKRAEGKRLQGRFSKPDRGTQLAPGKRQLVGGGGLCAWVSVGV